MIDDRWMEKVHKCYSRNSKWTKSCKRQVKRCGLNCREDVLDCGHVVGWNVICMNGDEWNWSVQR